MDPNDHKNVNFIMSLSNDQFEIWAVSLSQDDIDYAVEIIKQARLDLLEQEDTLMNAQAEDNNFAEAREVLSRFRL
jgi:hypothetical protein